MYQLSSLVTLLVDKTHGEEGEDSYMSVRSGIAGMVVSMRARGNDAGYIVDFGPQGQWNCTQEEISGEDDGRGWDADRADAMLGQAPRRGSRPGMRIETTSPPPGDDNPFAEALELPQDGPEIERDRPTPSNAVDDILAPLFEEAVNPGEPPVYVESNKIDADSDIERRIRELEKIT